MKAEYPHTIYEIPIEHKNDFDNSPYESMRDLLAIPALVKDSLFPNPKVIEDRINLDRDDPVDEINLYRWMNSTTTTPKDYNIFNSNLNPPDPDASYFMHVDLALVEDATGVSMVHRDPKTGKVIVDFCLAVEAHKMISGQIPIGRMKEIALFLKYRRGYNMALVSYDGWQSQESMQELIENGIDAKYQSVDRTSGPYDTLRDVIHSGMLDFYDYKSIEYKGKNRSIVRELLNLSKNNITGKVDHITSGSKDVSDSLAGAVFGCISMTQDFLVPFTAVQTEDRYNEVKSPYDEIKQDLNTDIKDEFSSDSIYKNISDPLDQDLDYNERSFYDDF